MVKEVKAYECEVCETAYFEESMANECQKYHLDQDKMQVDDCFYKHRSNAQFPEKVLISCSNYSGKNALYTIVSEGSVEEFAYLYPDPDDE